MIVAISLLYLGADRLSSGILSVAYKIGLKPFLLVFTVLSLGVGSPEISLNFLSTIKSNGNFTIAGIIGANIINLTLILGIASIIKPIRINMSVIKTDALILIFSTLLFITLLLDGEISKVDAIILFFGFTIYIIVISKKALQERVNDKSISESIRLTKHNLWVDFLYISVAIILLIWSSLQLINQTSFLVEITGISRTLVTLTILAAISSLPELIFSIIALRKNESDITMATLISSSIFNILFVTSIIAFVSPVTKGEIKFADMSILLLSAAIVFPISKIAYTIERKEGLILLTVYFIYLYILIMRI